MTPRNRSQGPAAQGPSKTPADKRDRIMSRQEIERMVLDGQTIVIFNEDVLKLDAWLERHPGGRLAILHMVGKDATDEIVAYHSDATVRTMRAFRIARKPMGPWVNLTPPIRGGPHRHLGHLADREDTESPLAGTITPAVTITPPPVLSLSGNDAAADAPLLRRRVSAAPPSIAGSTTDDSSNTSDSGSSPPGSPSSLATTALDDIDDPNEPPKDPAKYVDWAVDQGVDKALREYPSLDLQVQQAIVHRYRQLHQDVKDQGLYECRYIEYGKEMVRYTTLFVLFLVFLRWGWYTVSAACLGFFWHQIMFTAHDAGHRAITHNFVIDTLIGIFIADFCCGLSIGWWKSSHNVHHLVTNQPEHDPDIQNLSLFATCPSFFKSISSTYYDGFVFTWDKAAEILIPYQQYTYYPIMAIARFNLYVLSWLHVLSSKSSGLGSSKAWWIRPTEMAGMACYWFLFGYCLLWRCVPTWTDRVIFVLVSHIVLMPLHVQINLSHWGMSTADCGDGEAFAQAQLRTTMDVDCPAWLDFIHGGLQFQAVHHLFPRVPRHNLRRAQVLVKQFSKDTQIPYSILSFVDGNRKVLGRLGEVSDQVRILASCQKQMAEAGEMGLH